MKLYRHQSNEDSVQSVEQELSRIQESALNTLTVSTKSSSFIWLELNGNNCDLPNSDIPSSTGQASLSTLDTYVSRLYHNLPVNSLMLVIPQSDLRDVKAKLSLKQRQVMFVPLAVQ